MIALRIVAALAGVVTIGATMGSAVRTVVLPRGIPMRLARFVFLSMRWLFDLRIGRKADYARTDRIMALYAPTTLLALLFTWLGLVFLGYAALYWASGSTLAQALVVSGSSLTTLGFEKPDASIAQGLAVSEALLGLILLALLITYLPSLYGAFQRREALVAMLEVRADTPPSGVVMIRRFCVLGRLERLAEEVWRLWEPWFVEVEESHTSLPALTFFRSPQPDRSWITAAGAVLDAASLMSSTVDVEREVEAELCIRAGYLALRRIASFFGIPFDPDPRPDDPISVTREDFDTACAQLRSSGVPLRDDLDQAWRDFAGWRVNYDGVLLALAGLTVAPPAPWSSDRARPTRREYGFRGLRRS